MIDHDDLKWLAANSTELNRLLQQLARSCEQARRDKGESDYLGPLEEQVGQASRLAQGIFDRVTSRILSGRSDEDPSAPLVAATTTAPARAGVSIRMPVGEIADPIGQADDVPIRNPQGARELILLVDDDQDLLARTGEILDFEDYRVVTAKDGIEALQIYRRLGDKISLIILDYFLPVMDGDAVFDELKTIDPAVRVVLSSGFSEQATLGNMLARGLRGFLPKPYTHEKLIEQVRLILDA